MGTATTGTVCPCACESHVRAANPGDPFFDYFLSNYLSTFHQTIDEGSGTWDQHERFLQTHRCVFIPCSRVWQVLNSASCLECACANCQCTLGELGDIAWQPFLKPVCSYFWIIFGFSVFLERNKTVQGARAEVFLNGFKAVSRVIPTMFFGFFFYWQHLGGCTLSLNTLVRFRLSTIAALSLILRYVILCVSYPKSRDSAKSSGFCLGGIRPLNVIY